MHCPVFPSALTWAITAHDFAIAGLPPNSLPLHWSWTLPHTTFRLIAAVTLQTLSPWAGLAASLWHLPAPPAGWPRLITVSMAAPPDDPNTSLSEHPAPMVASLQISCPKCAQTHTHTVSNAFPPLSNALEVLQCPQCCSLVWPTFTAGLHTHRPADNLLPFKRPKKGS